MTKQQLLNELSEKFYKVGVIEEAEDSSVGKEIRKQEGVKWYLVGVYEQQGDVLIRRNIPIYVENEGKADEKAFYGEKMPQEHIIPQPEENPFKDVEGQIEEKTKDYAVVKKYVIESGEAVEKRFLVKKEGDKFVETPIREK